MSQPVEKGPFDDPDSHRTLALEVENRIFWIPRDTLAAISPVFKAMLYGEFAEANKDSIPLPGKKAADIGEILKYLIPYPDMKSFDFTADLTKTDLFLEFAEEYQIDYVRCWASDALIGYQKKLEESDERLLQILVIASKYQMKELLPEIIKRCGMEFDTDKLETVLENLRSKVITCLMMYANSVPFGQKCQFAKTIYDFRYRYVCWGADTLDSDVIRRKKMKCVNCGNSDDDDDDTICAGFEKKVKALLDRL